MGDSHSQSLFVNLYRLWSFPLLLTMIIKDEGVDWLLQLAAAMFGCLAVKSRATFKAPRKTQNMVWDPWSTVGPQISKKNFYDTFTGWTDVHPQICVHPTSTGQDGIKCTTHFILSLPYNFLFNSDTCVGY